MIRKWYLALRVWSLTATLIPIGVGGMLAKKAGQFSVALFLLTLACGLCLQSAANLLNGYVDGISGVDKCKGPPPVSLTSLRNGGLVFIVISMLLAGTILWLTTWKLVWFALAGILGASFYTGRFFKYAGFGVPGVFLLMGVLEVTAAFFVQTQMLSSAVLLASVPVACLVAAILHGNDLGDEAIDRDAGIKTTTLILGTAVAKHLYAFLNFTPYVCVVAGVLLGYFGSGALLTALTIPLAVRLTLDSYRSVKLESLAERSAGFHFLFGVLLIVGLAL